MYVAMVTGVYHHILPAALMSSFLNSVLQSSFQHVGMKTSRTHWDNVELVFWTSTRSMLSRGCCCGTHIHTSLYCQTQVIQKETQDQESIEILQRRAFYRRRFQDWPSLHWYTYPVYSLVYIYIILFPLPILSSPKMKLK